MRKIISSVIITCMLLMSFCNICYAATTFQPAIAVESGAVGDTITVTVSLPANTNAAGGSFNLIYDNTKMELVDATAGDIITAFSKTVNKSYAENKVRLNFAGSETVSANGGVVLNATFKLTASGTATFSTEKFKLADIDTNYLTCADSTQNISITSGGTSSAFTPTITAENGTVGDTINVTVSIPANTNAAGGSFNLVYDNTKMELVDATAGDIISAFSKTVNKTYAENKVRLNFAGSETVSASGGIALNASFKLTAAGTATFSTEKFKLADIDTNYLTCENASKSITISAASTTVAVTGVSLNKTSTTLTVGETETLTATVAPTNATNKNVSWTSSNTSVASVSNGVITAKAAGTTTITVTTADGSKTATCNVTVNAATVAVTGVSLNKTSTTLTVGGTETLTATVAPSNATNKTVSWTSSNTSVASVSNGVITAKAAGTATITVKTADGSKTATCTVTVNAATVAVTGVSLNKTSTTLTVGGTETLAATVAPTNATNKNVSWTSSNTNVASVSNGVVTAKAAGTATITVTTADGSKTATCTVTVNAATVAVTGVSLNKTSTTLTVGETEVLTATVAPSNATNKNVSWTSSNTNVASVSNGVITAKAAGTATITVTTADGSKTASCTVTVNAAIDENSPTITVSDVTGRAGNTVDVSISIKNNPGIISMLLDVAYDKNYLSLTAITNGDVLNGATHNINALTANPYTLSWADDTAENNNTSNGTIVTFTFKISDDAPAGKLPITVTYDNNNAAIYDKDMQLIDFAVVNGGIEVKDYLIGDLNDDGKINSFDRTIIARYIAKWDGYEASTFIFEAADVNNDNLVNAFDRTILARHVAKWDDYLTLPYIK